MKDAGTWLHRWFSLEGKVALVTGASRGIGFALARGMAGAGADLAINSSSQSHLETARDQLSEFGVRVEIFPADVADLDAARTLVDRVVQTFGGVDILVNCAGINRRMPIVEVTPDDYEAIMNVNLRGAYVVSQAAARAMMRQGGGKIVNIGSITNFIGLSGVSVYGMSKAGLQSMTRTMAVEWAEHNIQVNCIAPGFFMTQLTEQALWGDERKRQWMLDRIPIRRAGEPDDLVGTLLLLVSGASSYLTGQTIVVDGGFLAGSPW